MDADPGANLARADVLLVFSTFPAAARAREIAHVLVGERLAACANVLPGVTSVYVWQGEQTESEEALVLFKTRRESYPALEARLRSLHPYDVPEIVAVELAAGLPAYLDWVATGTNRDRAGWLLERLTPPASARGDAVSASICDRPLGASVLVDACGPRREVFRCSRVILRRGR